jgi:hypothetical protein
MYYAEEWIIGISLVGGVLFGLAAALSPVRRLIFDSEDGGMMAATVPALRQWKTGALSDEAFLRRCFIDPLEAFGFAANP